MHSRYLEHIKSFEGFTPTAKWDYAQHSNGFGTKALHAGEQITRDEAERRFAVEIEKARQFAEKHAKDWDSGTKAALTSLTFNAGTRWATSGLGEALRKSDVASVKSHFLAYTKAGGVDLPGLIKRRLVEVAWIGEDAAPSSTKPVAQPPIAGPATQTPPPIQNRFEQCAAPEYAHAQTERATAVYLDSETQMAPSAWLLLFLENELLRPGLSGNEARATRPPRAHPGA